MALPSEKFTALETVEKTITTRGLMIINNLNEAMRHSLERFVLAKYRSADAAAIAKVHMSNLKSFPSLAPLWESAAAVRVTIGDRVHYLIRNKQTLLPADAPHVGRLTATDIREAMVGVGFSHPQAQVVIDALIEREGLKPPSAPTPALRVFTVED